MAKKTTKKTGAPKAAKRLAKAKSDASKKAPRAKAASRDPDAPKKKRGRPAAEPIPYHGPKLGLGNEQVQHLPIDEIDIDDQTFQMRVSLNTKELEDSIKTHGVMVAITVRPSPRKMGYYQIISGFQRTLTARRAGQSTIPAIVRKFDDEEAYVHAYAENAMRKNFRDLDRAVAIGKLRDEQKKTTSEISQLVRLSERQVQRLEGLTLYEPELKAAMIDETIQTTHAMLLHQAKKKKPDLNLQEKVDEVVEGRLSADQLRKALAKLTAEPRPRGNIVHRNDKVWSFTLKNIENADEKVKKDAVKAVRELLRRLGEG